MRRRVGGMMNRLVLAVTCAVALAGITGAYLFSRHHYEDLKRSALDAAQQKASLIRLVLEHQMEENQRDLIAQMVASFALDPSLSEVRILDRTGEARFSSAGAPGPAADTPCRSCHEGPGAWVPATAMLEGAGGPLLRSLLLIENRPACHRCHDASQRVNGALVVDVRAAPLRDSVERDLRWMTIATGLVALGLLFAIAVIVRVVVLRRLERFETTARAIAGGDLDRRISAEGGDTLSWMARAFNKMADSVMQLGGELREQRERLETVINSVDDGIVVLDPDKRILAVNDAFLARLGKRRGEVLGRVCVEVLGRPCPLEDCPAERCFEHGSRENVVLTLPTADARARYEELHASPIQVGQQVAAVVEVWRDITDRRVAEVRMAESHRMASLGLLASGFSHEMNTPLGTTLTCVEGLARLLEGEGPIAEAERRGMLERARLAREQVLRCRGITQQFLRLSRGQSAATDLVDLGPIARAVARLAEPMARERGVTVACADPDVSAVVRASESELQQVLLNLVLNACQACAQGGRVEIEVLPGERPRLRVRDDGCGIPPEQLQRIFEPFYGLRPGGTGLGLFLSLSMARGWGADIQVQSRPGAGSTFELVFAPAARARNAAEA